MRAYRCVVLWAAVGLLCLLPGHLTAQQAKSPDFSGNGAVDFDDFFLFASAFGQSGTGANAKFDLNGDSRVDSSDFLLFAQNFGKQASAVSLTPPSAPGPNTGAKFTAALDKTSGVKAGDIITLTLSVTGASGLTGYVAEALYDSAAVGNPVVAAKLTGAISPGGTSEAIATVTGFNRRTEASGALLGGTPVNGNAALTTFQFTTKAGFTATSIGIRRLILVAGSKLDTISVSPSPLVLQINPSQAGGVVIKTSKQVYVPNEKIVVEFSGLPGNLQDWVTVVKASADTSSYDQYFYTEGKQSGSFTFDGLPAGKYEARLYFNWPDGGYKVQARYAFTVEGTPAGGGSSSLSIRLSVSSLTFDSTAVGSNTQKGVTVSNTGTAALSIGTITVVGADAAMFKVSPPSMTLAAGAVGTVTVGFFPTSVGLKAAALSLSHNAAGSPSTVALTGVGKQASTQPPPTTQVPEPAKQDSTKLGAWLDLNTASGNQYVASGSAGPGTEVTLQVFGRNLTSAISFGVTLGYDPAVLTPVISKFQVGDYLPGAIPLPAQVSTSGGVTQVTFGAAVLGGSPKSGNGFLGTVVFKVSDKFTDGYVEIKVNRLTLGTATAAIQTSNAILKALKNAPPVAKFTLKPDAIKAGDTKSLVTLDASGSSDPDGDPITYKWTASAGMTFKKSTSDSSKIAQVQVAAETTTNVTFTLTVTDKNGAKTAVTQTLKVIAPPSATAAAAVDLDPAADNQDVGLLYGAKAGDTFTLQVFVRDVTGGTGYSIKASYDTVKVGTPTYAHGPLIAGAIALPAKVSGGVIEGGASILGGSPVSGSGLLATFTFKAKDGFEGGSTLSVTSINLQMGTTRKELVTGSLDAQVTADVPVKASNPANFTESGTVGFEDFFLFAGQFDTKVGDANWDARFDLNGDGKVDFEDFFVFAVAFGLTE